MPDVKARELFEPIQESASVEIKPVADESAAKSIVQNEIASLKLELIKEIKESKVDTIKWMFAFWVGTIGIALLFYFLKK